MVGRCFARQRVRRFYYFCFNKYEPSPGAGETPLVGLAPANDNAIFAATGIRLRSLPMLPEGRLSKNRTIA
jgi:hypothetical protein